MAIVNVLFGVANPNKHSLSEQIGEAEHDSHDDRGTNEIEQDELAIRHADRAGGEIDRPANADHESSGEHHLQRVALDGVFEAFFTLCADELREPRMGAEPAWRRPAGR